MAGRGANDYVDQTYGSMGKLSGGTYVPWNQNTLDCLSAVAGTYLWYQFCKTGPSNCIAGFFPFFAQWGTCNSGTRPGTFYSGYSSISDTCW